MDDLQAKISLKIGATLCPHNTPNFPPPRRALIQCPFPSQNEHPFPLTRVPESVFHFPNMASPSPSSPPAPPPSAISNKACTLPASTYNCSIPVKSSTFRSFQFNFQFGNPFAALPAKENTASTSALSISPPSISPPSLGKGRG